MWKRAWQSGARASIFSLIAFGPLLVCYYTLTSLFFSPVSFYYSYFDLIVGNIFHFSFENAFSRRKKKAPPKMLLMGAKCTWKTCLAFNILYRLLSNGESQLMREPIYSPKPEFFSQLQWFPATLRSSKYFSRRELSTDTSTASIGLWIRELWVFELRLAAGLRGNGRERDRYGG